MTTKEQIVKRGGRRFVLVPEAEYHRLKRLDEPALPRLPQADEEGNRPAVEYATVSLARKLIHRRRELGLTQLELAERAGVRPETISRLESAKHVPSIATVDKIDRALKEAERKAGKKRAPAKTGTKRRKR